MNQRNLHGIRWNQLWTRGILCRPVGKESYVNGVNVNLKSYDCLVSNIGYCYEGKQYTLFTLSVQENYWVE